MIVGKKLLVGWIAVFVAWEIIDFLVHGVLLQSAYASTPQLWRPQAEIRMPTLYFTVAVSSFVFCAIYAWLVGAKSTGAAVRYGLLFGLGAGVSMGYATYAVQPIPYTMAMTWFFGSVVRGLVGGAILGAVVKE